MSPYSDALAILNSSFVIFAYALVTGIVPALFWLWFWMHEETKHREPRKILMFTFLMGMLGVFASLFIQHLFLSYFNPLIIEIGSHVEFIKVHSILNLIFVIIEEFVKFGAAYVIFLRTRLFRAPMDAFIYLMTAAIGFSAMENSLYLIKPLIEGQTIELFLNTNIRFIGASILHVTSSGLLALAIGYSFCKTPFMREVYVWLGLVAAILLHWFFNFLLLQSNNSLVTVFSSVWITAILLMLSLERIKKIKCDIKV